MWRKNCRRLAELGITAVELMPIAEFPGARNWGYDGALPFAPECTYGSPDDLRALVDQAHGHGLMIFLDVVYNRFGPDGNYLALYAPQMFRDDVATPWGPAIDFRRNEVRRFFTDNALYWLIEYQFDGLRFDAVHAITESDWLDEMASEVRKAVAPRRRVHLVLENDDNAASHLNRGFDAQWNDDGHHVLHVLLTGEQEGYYEDYKDEPAAKLARCLKEGFIYQGEPSPHRGGKLRGTRSADLPPTAFVLFLQNHDQIGNRAFGERLTKLANAEALEAAISLLLLSRDYRFCSWAKRPRAGHHSCFSPTITPSSPRPCAKVAVANSPASRSFRIRHFSAQLPDPNDAATSEKSKPVADGDRSLERERLYRKLLALRRTEIVPRLAGPALDAAPIGPAAVVAQWRMADGIVLTIATNLASRPVQLPKPEGRLIFSSSPVGRQSLAKGELAANSTIAVLGS